jgi:hypothetical protein
MTDMLTVTVGDLSHGFEDNCRSTQILTDLTRSVVLTPAARDAAVMWDRLCLTSAYQERRGGVSTANNSQPAEMQ